MTLEEAKAEFDILCSNYVRDARDLLEKFWADGDAFNKKLEVSKLDEEILDFIVSSRTDRMKKELKDITP